MNHSFEVLKHLIGYNRGHMSLSLHFTFSKDGLGVELSESEAQFLAEDRATWTADRSCNADKESSEVGIAKEVAICDNLTFIPLSCELRRSAHMVCTV